MFEFVARVLKPKDKGKRKRRDPGRPPRPSRVEDPAAAADGGNAGEPEHYSLEDLEEMVVEAAPQRPAKRRTKKEPAGSAAPVPVPASGGEREALIREALAVQRRQQKVVFDGLSATQRRNLRVVATALVQKSLDGGGGKKS